eukprot:5633114-Amphidinium_carterae.1
MTANLLESIAEHLYRLSGVDSPGQGQLFQNGPAYWHTWPDWAPSEDVIATFEKSRIESSPLLSVSSDDKRALALVSASTSTVSMHMKVHNHSMCVVTKHLGDTRGLLVPAAIRRCLVQLYCAKHTHLLTLKQRSQEVTVAMATVQIQVKLNAFETITVPIDADEDIAALM